MLRWLIAASLLIGCAGATSPLSPAQVVMSAADALDAGDKEAFEAHFTERSRPLLRLVLTRKGLGESVEEPPTPISALSVERERAMNLGHLAQQRVLVELEAAGKKGAVVVHDVGGAWRIDLMDSERALTGLSSPF